MPRDTSIAIWGKRGRGKSSLLRALQLRDPRPWLIIDPMREHAPRPGARGRLGDFVWRPESTGDELADQVDELARWAFRRGNLVFAFDETDTVVRPGGHIPEGLDYLARYGRHQNVGLVLAARRPSGIPPALASQCYDLYSFRQTAPQDLLYFRALGIDPEILRELRGHDFLHWSDAGAHVHKSPWHACPGEKEE